MIIKLIAALLTLTLGYSFSQKLPKKQPNIIVVLADDMGYSDIGCFGSEIHTPNLDSLANNGLRMTQFYNASRCCPTRASLLTGLYQHQAGVGNMIKNLGPPSYQGYLNQRCVTIAEVLRLNGYRTYMTGKWHVGSAPEHWPLKRGFDRYYGLIEGASSYFNNEPYRPERNLTTVLDDKPVKPGNGYYATDAYTDYALEFMDNNAKEKPFFLYLAYTAPHWPLHALPDDIARYKGKYKKGWDHIRAERFRRMKAMSIIDSTVKLSPRDPAIPAWDELSDQEKNDWDDKMAVYAAMIDRMDQNIGRIINKLNELREDQNTVIMFLSDNGASHEDITPRGFLPQIYQRSKLPASDPNSFTAYGRFGANVSNTPFRQYKHWEYEGGTATPFIAYGASFVKGGQTDHRPAHIIDIMATCLDLAGVAYPQTYKGNAITPTEGVSLLPVFRGLPWVGHRALFFEHVGNRAVQQGDWKLVSQKPATNWELYNMKTDRSELIDLSSKEPQRVKKLAALYEAWAEKVGVVPFEELTRK